MINFYVWFVTNGYRGNGYVTAIVMAENEEDALEKGKEALKEEVKKQNNRLPERLRHPEDTWISELKAERIDLPHVTEIG